MKLRIAIIGQSQFAVEVFKLLTYNGHIIAGIFTIPDSNGKSDPLAEIAAANGVPFYKFSHWRHKGIILPEVFEAYKSINADLNVLPYCSQFIPMEVINYPIHKSIIYHPSILPKHRGASAINWTLIHGDNKSGFSIFWADDGLDTGPILLIRECRIEINDTVDTLYNRFLYPEGIKAIGDAVKLIANNTAPCIVQSEEGASYEPIMKKDIAELKSTQSALEMHNFIRGCDPTPGAWVTVGEEKLSLFGSIIWKRTRPRGKSLKIEKFDNEAIIHKDGIWIGDNFGGAINISRVQLQSGKMMQASKYGQSEDTVDLTLTEEEVEISKKIETIWKEILGISVVEKDTDFFKSGGGSMQVVRLVEEINSNYEKVKLLNEDVYMATTFNDFLNLVVLKGRGGLLKKEFTYNAIEMTVNKRQLKIAHQLFINNEFVDASDGRTFDTINPTDQSVICKVALATKIDVDEAVDAAHYAFYEGEWGKMNARDRGYLMYRLAELMAEHREELAIIESLDSGAVYTLALKTHIGMSIDVFHYFAGWCDKIHGTTIPINNARPNKNLTLTKREPFGVCGIITPWNYPLMMLSWKMAACLAAGNTVILKPALFTPLTSLKFCELVVKAGFPPGVINILPGSGELIGQAMTSHPRIRKLAFTGSTEIGKSIMQSCGSSNLKKVSLELGGKSPLIIFNDCDFEKAVRMGCSAAFFNKGENCIAAGRLFVEENIHDRYITRVIEEVKKMKIGNPLDTSVDHGPCNHKTHLEYLLKYIERGVAEGATLAYGGTRVDGPGLFLVPAVFTNVIDDMNIAKEESFGPIMIILKFTNGDIDGVLERANSSEYGLASGVFTSDINKALKCAEKLAAGTVFVNTYNKTDVAAPFGGYKQSGFGKDLGEEALNEYLQTKTITVEY